MRLFEELIKRIPKFDSSTGTKIRLIRLRKGISADELGTGIGVTGKAIRNYESGARKIKPERVKTIAHELNVPIETLENHNINNVLGAIHIIFELYDNGLIELEKTVSDKPTSLVVKNELILKSFEAWHEQINRYERGEISAEELKNWQDSFPYSYKENKPDEENNANAVRVYSTLERLFAYKSTVETQYFIVRAYVEELIGYMDNKDYRYAKSRLEALERTIKSCYESTTNTYR